MMNEPLFRQEALQFSAQQTLGNITTFQPVTLRVLTILLLAMTTAAGTYLWLGEYARRQTIYGYLEPEAGTVSIYADERQATITSVYVRNDDIVQKDQPLVQLEYPNNVSGNTDTLTDILEELEARKSELSKQLERHEEYYETEEDHLHSRIDSLELELVQQDSLMQLQLDRVSVESTLLASMDRLRESRSIAEATYLQAVANKLELEKEVIAIEQRILQLQSAKDDAVHNLSQLPIQRADNQLQIEIQLSAIQQEIAEVVSRQDKVLLSPVSGRVSALQAKVGATTRNGLPLLVIVPETGTLQCILLVPSSAVGFLEIDQPVRLMIDAYPHQQFGTLSAALIDVSKTAIAPNELNSPIRVNEPIYLATAKLESEYFTAMGERRRLQSGMLLKADVILEKRSLIDWLLEPFYSLRGRNS